MSAQSAPGPLDGLFRPQALRRTRAGVRNVRARRAAALLVASGALAAGYAALSAYIAVQMAYAPPEPVVTTPATYGLVYRDVAFASRGDHVRLRGWFIPGLLPDGRVTAHRTVIVLHGARSNRADPVVLAVSAALARHGFAVLAFDMRGMGESASAPLSMGALEQRDVWGAVDFLRSGPVPYPQLGRPAIIGGWGVSMGAATLLMAAAYEPAIRAVVADSAYADIAPIMERELPARSGLPPVIVPGVTLAVRLLYGIDYRTVRPIAGVARLAPRPVLFIGGSADTFNPPATLQSLAAAARVPGAHVQTWLVRGAGHAGAFSSAPDEYVRRVVTFFTSALGPDTPR